MLRSMFVLPDTGLIWSGFTALTASAEFRDLSLPLSAVLCATAACVTWLFPNTSQIMRRAGADLPTYPVVTNERGPRVFEWRPQTRWAIFAALLAGFSFADLFRVTEFLYFNF
jgi:hypothetical protein